jgi:hypothetical protein
VIREGGRGGERIHLKVKTNFGVGGWDGKLGKGRMRESKRMRDSNTGLDALESMRAKKGMSEF